MTKSDLDNPEWLQRLAVLTRAEKTWHKFVLSDTAVANRIKEVLDNSNIGNYIWNTDDLVNDVYWARPIKNGSSAKTIYFENEADIVMFKLLM